jgi:hypothetical protein
MEGVAEPVLAKKSRGRHTSFCYKLLLGKELFLSGLASSSRLSGQARPEVAIQSVGCGLQDQPAIGAPAQMRGDLVFHIRRQSVF